MGASPDGTHLLYYDDGVFFVLRHGERQIDRAHQADSPTFWEHEDDHNVVKPPTQSFGWAKDSSAVLLQRRLGHLEGAGGTAASPRT